MALASIFAAAAEAESSGGVDYSGGGCTPAAAVQNGANVANNDGRTPLHVAAVNNNIEMCKVFLLSVFFALFCRFKYLLQDG